MEGAGRARGARLVVTVAGRKRLAESAHSLRADAANGEPFLWIGVEYGCDRSEPLEERPRGDGRDAGDGGEHRLGGFGSCRSLRIGAGDLAPSLRPVREDLEPQRGVGWTARPDHADPQFGDGKCCTPNGRGAQGACVEINTLNEQVRSKRRVAEPADLSATGSRSRSTRTSSDRRASKSRLSFSRTSATIDTCTLGSLW